VTFLKLFFLAIFLIVLYFYIYIPYKYKLPVNDHSDGKKFYNLGYKNESKKSFSLLFKWLKEIKDSRAKWPKHVPVNKYDVPPSIVEGDEIRVSFVGHASFLIQTSGLNIITDPIYSDRASMFKFIGPKRVTECGVKFEDLPKLDIVLVSHNHYDHLDKDTIFRLWKNHDPLFITSLRNDDLIRSYAPQAKIIALDWYQNHIIDSNINIALEPAHHWSSRWGLDKNRMLWGSFLVNSKKGSIVFIGDTGYDEKIFKEIAKNYPNILLSIIPIGAYEPRYIMQNSHVNPDEAVLIHKDLKSTKSIASHYITFQLTDEAYEKPEIDLEKAKLLYKIPPEDFIALKIGETIQIK
jgi:L-ascorbate metabolism protein UlaG (beta-lactamase superfamily)